MSFRLLIVEDSPELLEAASDFFREEGAGLWDVVTASDGNDALAKVNNESFDLMILDIMLPGASGFDICKAARKISDCPIIFLTALGSENNMLKGYETGCDDYVVKPFSPKELMARVNAVLSRVDASDKSSQTIERFDGLEVNFAARTISVDGKRIELTPKEYDLLFYMIQNKNIALSRDRLLSDIWGYDFFGDDRTIDTHVKNLRNSLGPYRKFIVTLRGVGYKFEYEG